MMTAPVSIEQVVIHHFDAFQQEFIQSEEECGVAEVQARATLMRRELEKFLASNNNNNKNNNDSLDDDEEEEENVIHQVTSTLLACVDHCMAADVSKDSIEIINGMLQLVACFAACSYQETTIPALVGRAIQYASSIMERVRIQACKLLGFCIQYSQQDDQESVEAARKTMIARLTDKSQAVRNAAICASSSFFTSTTTVEEHAVLLESLLWNMAHDPSAANRIAALDSIPVNPTTLDSLIARVRDEKVKVRVQALVTLGKKANGILTPEQHAQIVRSSLGNRCTATKDAATRLICASWMKHVRFDPIALVGLLDPVGHEPECTKVCHVLFQIAQETSPQVLEELSPAEIRAFQQGVSSATSILTSNTTADTYLEPRAVLVCKVKCDFVQSSNTTLSQAQQELAISKIVPQVAVLCDWLELHISRLIESIQQQDDDNDESNNDDDMVQEEDVFVCCQLLKMAQVTDLKEEGSRRHFIAAMKKLLTTIETPDELLEGSIQALLVAHQDESNFLQTISDIISELSTLYTSQKESEQENDNDSILQNVSTLRILTILAITLENTSASMASDSILQGFSFYIVPAITSRHALVREGGVSCLGRLALLSDASTVLEEFKPLLLRVASNTDEKLEIRAQAIMAICDLSFLFSEMLDTSQDGISFVPLLVELLGTSKPAVAAVAAEVASKLLFAGCTSDEHLLANLVVTYFDQGIASLENDEDDNDVVEIGSPVRMQQLLSLFFPAYGMRGTKCKSALASCIEPMLNAVAERLDQKGVKVSDWPMARMVEYVESLLDCTAASNADEKESSVAETNKKEEGEANTTSSQDKDTSPPSPEEPNYEALVAIQVSQFLLKNQESIKTTLVRQLCKPLGSTRIDVDTTDASTLSKLKTNMDELGMSVTDSTCLRSLKPLMELLDSLHANDQDDESTETEDDSDGESSLAEALKAIEVAERASMETTEKENAPVVSGEHDNGKGSSTSTRGRRRLASSN